ncbi:uncharacterized protein MYCGRDRAFT_103208 [Zymoseptoria tritici IPO323]|uniref:Uncharacterized protein n=1 Tax=Zymoseptoria tritici (strain CBS 115943 / IPO323) TaxID=336722 RepID=F9X282_ZYMTI|nr:uncharacterized protein MYCGRDRAFT_103208 [Zymoseptoria tritici IPO323]EGP90574.1 hypothetical protein MYCGRDRAFT_103208 [Zymoseptoria tritici IPO323]
MVRTQQAMLNMMAQNAAPQNAPAAPASSRPGPHHRTNTVQSAASATVNQPNQQNPTNLDRPGLTAEERAAQL